MLVKLITELTKLILSVKRSHPRRIAIDGVDAAGKTEIADELDVALQVRGHHVIRASIDGFHSCREIRYRRGRNSPEGYYHDSFNYEALRTLLLEPLGPGGSLYYQSSVFDFRKNSATSSLTFQAEIDSILIFDGVFLLRPELKDFWDYTIFIEADFAITIERAKQRDQVLFGTAEQVEERYHKRYIPGQRIYLKSCRPQNIANVVVNNNDPANPELQLVNSASDARH